MNQICILDVSKMIHQRSKNVPRGTQQIENRFFEMLETMSNATGRRSSNCLHSSLSGLLKKYARR